MGVERVIEFGEDQKELIRRMINRTNLNLEVLVINSPERLEEVVQKVSKEYEI